LLSLKKRYSNNLLLDFNYSYSHSIDNQSNIFNDANQFTFSGQGLICDLTNLRTCRADSLFDARHISSVNAVDHQREHFASLSNNMYELLKALKSNTATLYEQYCPMKKAYWLSESQQIKNPYFGSQMPTCGKVTATLAPAK